MSLAHLPQLWAVPQGVFMVSMSASCPSCCIISFLVWTGTRQQPRRGQDGEAGRYRGAGGWQGDFSPPGTRDLAVTWQEGEDLLPRPPPPPRASPGT